MTFLEQDREPSPVLHHCYQCDSTLTGDEISLYKKLVSRGAEKYLCLSCLSGRLKVSEERLKHIIAYYHRTGECALFAKE